MFSLHRRLYWVSAQLKPGTDVVCLKCLFPRCPVSRQNSTPSSPMANYGFVVNKQQIVAKGLCGKSRPCRRLFEGMKLSIQSDINA